MRAFEHDGERYLYGYGIIFDSPDGHGTVMTRKFVENNIERLRKFPAIRFMHQDPLGQIVWDEEVDGKRTFIDNHGLHLLVRVYSDQDDKWRMINEGNWGFSWSANPTRMGQACFPDGKCYPSFEDGKMWEISVVDSPSHMDATTYILKRSLEWLGKPMQTAEISDILPLASDGVSLTRAFERARNEGEQRR
jgi:hypothetical protein